MNAERIKCALLQWTLTTMSKGSHHIHSLHAHVYYQESERECKWEKETERRRERERQSELERMNQRG